MDNQKKTSFDSYLDEIGDMPLLSDAEEQSLSTRIQQGDERAVNELIRPNLPFVVSLAKGYLYRGLDIDDLVSEGNFGMLKAAMRFDGRQGKRFVAFAAPYIREAIEHAIEQQAGLYRVPRNVEDSVLEKRRSKALSIDAPIGGSAELSLGRVIADKDAPLPEGSLEHGIIIGELQRVLGQLDERQQRVVQSFYGIGEEPQTMAEIAQKMGVKRERVRQIRKKAVRHILKITGNTELKHYLKA